MHTRFCKCALPIPQFYGFHCKFKHGVLQKSHFTPFQKEKVLKINPTFVLYHAHAVSSLGVARAKKIDFYFQN